MPARHRFFLVDSVINGRSELMRHTTFWILIAAVVRIDRSDDGFLPARIGSFVQRHPTIKMLGLGLLTFSSA
jgi:hypothetical protein